jgi:dihydrofolate synthase / folylpolyglutamate synthase
MKLGLAAIDALCERLGRPERDVPSVLVAGTNGKGSAAATLSAIATAAGARTGLYTSPHLHRAGERIRIAEEDVTDDELEEILARVFLAADTAPEIPATYFEILTAAAFLAFSARSLDLAVLEVGLGGRFDATNVAPASLSVVTSIGLDHVEELGPTLASIAREKAGVFRRGRPALVGWLKPEPASALLGAARETGALLHEAEREIVVADRTTSVDGTRFSLGTPLQSYALKTPLAGAHQARNVALAVRAAELLGEALPGRSREAVASGVAATRWPGRLEKVKARGRTVLLDGCHNAEGAAALALFLRETGLAGRVRLVFGAMADKDIEEIAAVLFPAASTVRLVTAPSPRAATAEELSRRTAAVRPDAVASPSLDFALRELLDEPDPAPIIVAGSLYLVGAARSEILSGRLEDA